MRAIALMLSFRRKLVMDEHNYETATRFPLNDVTVSSRTNLVVDKHAR
jgi:hypothetical protein